MWPPSLPTLGAMIISHSEEKLHTSSALWIRTFQGSAEPASLGYSLPRWGLSKRQFSDCQDSQCLSCFVPNKTNDDFISLSFLFLILA